MDRHIFPDKITMGAAAASAGAVLLRAAIAQRGRAQIIVATGASQFEMLAALIAEPDIAWDVVTAFHLDEYVGLPIAHPASFRKYLWERFVSRLPLPLAAFHYLNGDCATAAAAIAGQVIDVAFVGIGENGHLAFNDPPADFTTDEAYLIVDLDETCRRQQWGEGWFPTLGEVPRQAISMSIRQILKSTALIVTVPDERKALAVRDCLQGPITPLAPASILQTHARTQVFLDTAAARLLA